MSQLKRYTELPYALQVLKTQKLTLVSPTGWDDKNDSHFMLTYRDRTEYGSILALCLTEAPQTYHHWRVFTHGASGACLYFDKQRLVEWIEDSDVLEGRPVEYKTLNQLRARAPQLADLPYIKRKAYEHESEFRLVYKTRSKGASTRRFSFPLEVIDGVVLNPWLPQPTADAIEDIIHAIPGCEELSVSRATIVKNDEWQRMADAATEV